MVVFGINTMRKNTILGSSENTRTFLASKLYHVFFLSALDFSDREMASYSRRKGVRFS